MAMLKKRRVHNPVTCKSMINSLEGRTEFERLKFRKHSKSARSKIGFNRWLQATNITSFRYMTRVSRLQPMYLLKLRRRYK